MSRCKITHSLLSSWKYATGENSTPEQWCSFLNTLNRIKEPQSTAMIEGIHFEFQINQAAGGLQIDCYDDKAWDMAVKRFGRVCKGGTQQVKVTGNRAIDGHDYSLVGVADVVKAGIVYDIKKVVRYEYGKYAFSTQHPMYFELIPETNKFEYLIFDGNMCYTETYRKGDFEPIGSTIAQFRRFLKEQDLEKTYIENWRV